MFDLGAAAGDGVQFGFDIGQFRPGAGHIHFIDQAGLIASFLKLHRVPAKGNGCFDDHAFASSERMR